MAINNVMIKNKHYDGTRLTLVGSQSGVTYNYYSEAQGTRYFVNQVSSTASATMESVTFKAHLTFTSSGTQSWEFNLIPMYSGETVLIDTKISAMNTSGSKGYLMNSFGGYRHSGSALSVIGSGISYTHLTDFTSASASFGVTGTASVKLITSGQTSETIDWDIHISYTKGYHSLISGGGGTEIILPPPWYPPPPPLD